MFNKGEAVVYGQSGVCEIIDISEKELSRGVIKTYYVLKPVYQAATTIYAPIDNTAIHIRPVITKKEAEKLISLIPKIKKKDFSGISQNEMAEKYLEAVYSKDCEELICLTMSIYAKKQEAAENNKKLGAVDERYMQKAQALLFGELAFALEIEPEQVKDYIKEATDNK